MSDMNKDKHIDDAMEDIEDNVTIFPEADIPADVQKDLEQEYSSVQTDGPLEDEQEKFDADAVETEDSGESKEQLKQIIAALQTEIDTLKDRSLRAVAEAENTRRRAEKDVADAKKYGAANFAKSLLSVADNLRRAIDAVPEELKTENEAVKNLTVGVEATERELIKAFEQIGIKQLNPLGEIFDPNFHEVMFEMEAAGQTAGTILQVIEVGYQIHDRILRPARVGVAKNTGDNTPTVGVDEMA